MIFLIWMLSLDQFIVCLSPLNKLYFISSNCSVSFLFLWLLQRIHFPLQLLSDYYHVHDSTNYYFLAKLNTCLVWSWGFLCPLRNHFFHFIGWCLAYLLILPKFLTYFLPLWHLEVLMQKLLKSLDLKVLELMDSFTVFSEALIFLVRAIEWF